MMKKISIIAFGILILSVLLSFIAPSSLLAQSNEQALCEGSGGVYSDGSCTKPGDNKTVGGFIQDATNILMFVVGAVSVVMFILGGFKYVVSNGDQALIKQAKDTMLYAAIGLIAAISSYAIINFVVSNI